MTLTGDFASNVRLEGVRKHLGAAHALRDIDLSIGRKEIVVSSATTAPAR